jgi:hypothetical protein
MRSKASVATEVRLRKQLVRDGASIGRLVRKISAVRAKDKRARTPGEKGKTTLKMLLRARALG